MTGKQQSDEDVAHVGRSEPNLGQKEAKLEKASEAQLRHIEGVHVTTAPGRFIAWCKQEEASIEQQLQLMETGKVRTGEDIGQAGSTRPLSRSNALKPDLQS
jgi:hypothetical protein